MDRGSFATARVGTNKATGEKVAIKSVMRSHENFDKELCKLAFHISEQFAEIGSRKEVH
jgi:hypothetical protein